MEFDIHFLIHGDGNNLEIFHFDITANVVPVKVVFFLKFEFLLEDVAEDIGGGFLLHAGAGPQVQALWSGRDERGKRLGRSAFLGRRRLDRASINVTDELSEIDVVRPLLEHSPSGSVWFNSWPVSGENLLDRIWDSRHRIPQFSVTGTWKVGSTDLAH